MKHFLRIALLLLIFTYKSYGQATVAVITDVQQEVKLYPTLRSLLTEQSFPDYFSQDSLWQQTVRQALEVQVKQKLGAAAVYAPDSSSLFRFMYAGTPLPARLKLADTERTNAAYFVAFTNTITLTTTAVEESGLPTRHYQSTAEIKIEDKDRKTVFTNKVIIPFRTTVSLENGLYGETEISEKDWKDLFLQSVAAVFKEGTKRLPLRTYYRPRLNEPKYQTFLNKTQTYLLQQLASNIPSQKGQPHKARYVYKNTKTGKAHAIELLQVYTGSLQSLDNTYACRVDLSEDITQTDYQLWMHLNWLGSPGSAAGGIVQTPKAEVQIRCMSQGLLAGNFVLNNQSMEGRVGYQVYTLNHISPKNTYELVANDKLLALIQRAGNGKAGDTPTQDYALYIHPDVSQESQGELATIFLMYKLAAEFGKDFL